jgi:hypothetical protein
MFGLFKSRHFSDPQLGELRRHWGVWRGSVVLDNVPVPLLLSGSRTAPNPEALEIARSISSRYPTWCLTIGPALVDHFTPYAEGVAAREIESPRNGLPQVNGPKDVWRYTKPEFIHIDPQNRQFSVEIGYRVDWDEEHTLGARLCNGEFVELCGSVLAP